MYFLTSLFPLNSPSASQSPYPSPFEDPFPKHAQSFPPHHRFYYTFPFLRYPTQEYFTDDFGTSIPVKNFHFIHSATDDTWSELWFFEGN